MNARPNRIRGEPARRPERPTSFGFLQCALGARAGTASPLYEARPRRSSAPSTQYGNCLVEDIRDAGR